MPRGRFVTLENFILDTFTRIEEDGTEYPIDRPDEIGGAGTYTLIGARIFLSANRVGMIIDYTPSTLPLRIKDKLEHYGEGCFIFRERNDGQPTLRAVNRYKGQLRMFGFEYLTQPIFLIPRSIAGTILQRPLPRVIHYVPMEERLRTVLNEVDEMKREEGNETWDPLIIWEPDIPTCKPENFGLFAEMTPWTHVISPNHGEAVSLLSLPLTSGLPDEAMRDILTRTCVMLAELKPKMAAIIRCGHLGCCYVDTSRPMLDQEVIWVPPFWDSSIAESKGKVVDPTGAGNAFMGGVGAALDDGQDIHEAVIWGTIAASFVIEQNGLPMLSTLTSGIELWNEEDPWDRIRMFRERLQRSDLA